MNNNGKWERVYTDRPNDKRIEEMARIASEDTIKQNYLEIKLKKDEIGNADSYRAVMRFKELDNKVIGHEAVVPFSLRELFSVHAETEEYTINSGLWRPLWLDS